VPTPTPHFSAIFEKKRVIEHKMCFDFLYKFFLKNFSLEKELSETLSKICIGLQVKQPFFLSDFKET